MSTFLSYAAVLFLVILQFENGICRGQATVPPQLADGWGVAKPGDAGFDEVLLTQLTQSIHRDEFPNTHAVVIEHAGRLVYEQYFEGTDERLGTPIGHREMNRDSLHDIRSISKSVTSVVLGIAVRRDYEQALTRPITSFFPNSETNQAHQAITLHHALTMTAGIKWNEMEVPYTDPLNDEFRLYRAKDPLTFVWKRQATEAPGVVWYYNGGLTQVLAGIVHRITGKPLDDYAEEVLFKPLGITKWEWVRASSWDQPAPVAPAGLRMRTRDLAKIGSVYLHGGRWQGKQIVPQEWLELSAKRHVKKNANAMSDWSAGSVYGYGYQWWHGRFPHGYTAIAGVGNGNQRLFVLPEERIVATVFAGEYNKFEGHSERLLHRIMAARAN